MFPTSIKPLAKVAKAKKEKAKGPGAAKGININLGPTVMKGKDLTVFTRQLAILLDAGLPLIRDGKTFRITSDIQTGAKYGMNTLDSHLVELYKKGMVSYGEVITKAQDPEGIVQTLANTNI